MKTKIRKTIIVVLIAVCCGVCLALGMANMKSDSEDFVATADTGIETYTIYNGEKDWEVEYVDGRYLITAYYGSSKTPTVPYIEVNEDYCVTGIADSVFEGSNITSITLHSSITYIGGKAFYKCTSLKTVNVGATDGLSYIGKYAFGYCESLTDISSILGCSTSHIGDDAFEYSGVTAVTIDYCTDVGLGAFRHCDSLKTVSISANLDSMGVMFAYCENLSSIYYNAPSATVRYVNDENFRDAGKSSGNLVITIGKNVKSIPSGLFSGYYSGTTVYAYNYAKEIAFESGCACTYIAYGAFCGCCNITSISLPSTVETIGNYAFTECSSLTSITIPESVTAIGSYAFRNSGITSAVFKDPERWYCSECEFSSSDLSSTSTAAKYLKTTYYKYNWYKKEPEEFEYTLSSDGKYYILTKFNNDKGTYTDVVIDATYESLPVKEIASSVFEDHTEITSITIPENITTIGSYAFAGCTYVTSICFNATAMDDLANDNGVFYNAGKNSGSIAVTIGANVTRIPGYLFYPYSSSSVYDPKISSVTFDSGSKCTEIGKYAFTNCDLTSLTIPENVTCIGKDAFQCCYYITEINFNATAVDDFSPSNCVFNYTGQRGSGITLTIGSNVTRIPAYLFNPISDSNNAPYITTIKFESGSKCTEIGGYAFAYISSFKSLTIPDSVISIGAYAFYNCTGLTSVIFENTEGWSVSKSGAQTDLNSSSLSNTSTLATYLRSTYCSYTWTRTESALVYTLSSDGTYYILTDCTGKFTSVVIDATYESLPVKEIAASVFEDHTEITSVTIPENITTIGSYAFSGCTYVTSIYFNATAMEDLANNNGIFYNVGKSGGGITLTIGANVTRIPAALFYSSTNSSYTARIATVIFESGSKCTEIGGYAFIKCAVLTSINIPSSVTTIGKFAFNTCSSLAAIIIPDGVVSIGDSAFKSCTALTSIVIPDSVTTLEYSAFYGCTALKSVTIGKGVTTVGGSVFNGCEALTEIIFNAEAMDDLSAEDYVFSLAGRSGAGITVTVGADVVRIPAYLFYPTSRTTSNYKPYITTVVFESGSKCTEIGEYAFYGLDELCKLYVDDLASYLSIDFADRYANPLSVVSANGGTFYVDESKITALTTKNTSGVTHIGTYALAYCTIITDIALGENVFYIGEHAFEGMSGLNSFTLSYYSGWTVYASSALSSGTKITSGELEGSALTYFTSTYVSYVWKWDYVSNVAPVVECKEVSSGGYTSGTFTVTVVVDASSSIWYIAYTDPAGVTFTSYYDATWTVTPTVNGTYEFVAVDTDGFTSETYYIIFDNTAPELYLGGAAAWANYNSSEFSVLAVDNLDGDVKLYYSLDGEDGEWILCDSNPYTVTPDSKCSTDGYWWFKAVDAAGNSTPAYRTVLDTVAVFGSWEFYDDMSLYFSYNAPSYTSWTCRVNGVEYSSGSPFSKDLTTYTAVLTSPNGSTLTAEKYLDHYFPDEGDVIDPTCQSMGYTVYTCVYCGETQLGNFLAACEHEYMEVTVDATCTTNGYSRAECIYCGGVKEGSYTPIYATGHKAVSGAYKAPTCTDAGYYGTVCEVCGAELETTPIEALGHLLMTETVPSTCVSYGYSLTYCTRDGCDYSVQNGLSGTDAYLTDHVYGDVLRVSATCTDDGYTYEKCEVCGYEHITILHATGHDFGQYYEAEDTETGLVTRWHTCKTCGFTESFELTSNADTAANGVIDIFQKYQKYMWWILLAFVGIWSLFIGLRYALSRNDEEKVKAKSMLANYILGLFVIAIVLVGLPYLIYGIAILVG